MDVLTLLKFMGDRGIRYPRRLAKQVFYYVENMISDERILTIDVDNELHTVMFFSICENYDEFLKKGDWVYREHNTLGENIVFEKIVSKQWNKSLRNDVKELILTKYPNLKIAKWYRYGKVGDRECTLWRREYV